MKTNTELYLLATEFLCILPLAWSALYLFRIRQIRLRHHSQETKSKSRIELALLEAQLEAPYEQANSELKQLRRELAAAIQFEIDLKKQSRKNKHAKDLKGLEQVHEKLATQNALIFDLKKNQEEIEFKVNQLYREKTIEIAIARCDAASQNFYTAFDEHSYEDMEKLLATFATQTVQKERDSLIEFMRWANTEISKKTLDELFVLLLAFDTGADEFSELISDAQNYRIELLDQIQSLTQGVARWEKRESFALSQNNNDLASQARTRTEQTTRRLSDLNEQRHLKEEHLLDLIQMYSFILSKEREVLDRIKELKELQNGTSKPK